MAKPSKPLGHKAYGSIPHLPGSRLGPGDYHCHEGQARIACEKTRDKHDRVIVMEKLDGACMSVAKVAGEIFALTRAGYKAEDGLYEHLKLFEPWVRERNSLFQQVLSDGERIVGEWLQMAHGTVYAKGPPFVVFDLFAGRDRLPHDTLRDHAEMLELPSAHILSDGPPVTVEAALSLLGDVGFHGAQELPEGVVWKVERKGAFDFNCKFVRHEKTDGKYLPGIGRDAPLWMGETA